MSEELSRLKRTGEKTSREASLKLTESVIDLIRENFGKAYTRLAQAKKEQINRRLNEKYYAGVYQYLANHKNVDNAMAKITVEVISPFFDSKELRAFSPFLYERIESYLREIYEQH